MNNICILLLISLLIVWLIYHNNKENLTIEEQNAWYRYLDNDKINLANDCYKGYVKNLSVRINSHPEFIELFNKFNITYNDYFLDIGSGTGLICFGMRKRYNFGKIIGIEMNKHTFDCALENLEILGGDRIVFINKSFFEYDIPHQVSFVYAYNPFYNQSYYDYESLEKAIIKLSERKGRIVIWMNIDIKDEKIKRIVDQNTKSYEEGFMKFPYLIMYF